MCFLLRDLWSNNWHRISSPVQIWTYWNSHWLSMHVMSLPLVLRSCWTGPGLGYAKPQSWDVSPSRCCVAMHGPLCQVTQAEAFAAERVAQGPCPHGTIPKPGTFWSMRSSTTVAIQTAQVWPILTIQSCKLTLETRWLCNQFFLPTGIHPEFIPFYFGTLPTVKGRYVAMHCCGGKDVSWWEILWKNGFSTTDYQSAM